MNDLVIQTRGLRKSYDGSPALRGIDLAVPSGSICGFLGRNGAGKTTTIKLLLNLLRPEAGEIFLFGDRIDSEAAAVAARRRIGFVSEEKQLYPYMTVGQTVRFTRPFFPGWRRDLEAKYLEIFQLPESKPVPKLSKGMRTQLMLLLALARGAELLILDEPTDGLDPAVTEDVLQVLAGLAAAEGTSIFFSSHRLAEVEQISDRVCLIDRGQIVIDGALDDFKRTIQDPVVFSGNAPAACRRWRGRSRPHARTHGFAPGTRRYRRHPGPRARAAAGMVDLACPALRIALPFQITLFHSVFAMQYKAFRPAAAQGRGRLHNRAFPGERHRGDGKERQSQRRFRRRPSRQRSMNHSHDRQMHEVAGERRLPHLTKSRRRPSWRGALLQTRRRITPKTIAADAKPKPKSQVRRSEENRDDDQPINRLAQPEPGQPPGGPCRASAIPIKKPSGRTDHRKLPTVRGVTAPSARQNAQRHRVSRLPSPASNGASA